MNRMVLVYGNANYRIFRLVHEQIRISFFQALEEFKVPYFPNVNVRSTTRKNSGELMERSTPTNTNSYFPPMKTQSTEYIQKSSHNLFEELTFKVKKSPKHVVCIVDTLSDFIGILHTLKTVHEVGVVHNGITTSNILKNPAPNKGNKLVITGWDFSFTNQPEDCTYGFRKRNLKHIPELLPYISPESTGESTSSVDYRSDFYSLGIVMYEMFVGCLPFQSEKPTNLIRMHILQKPIAPILLAGDWISEDLNRVILRLLEKKPSKRYIDCGTIINELIAIKNAYIDHIKYTSTPEVYNYWINNSFYKDVLKKEPPFVSNSIGAPTTFIFPSAVKARSKEYIETLNIYEASLSGTNMIILSGPLGYDKVAVLDELKLAPLSRGEYYFTWNFTLCGSTHSTYQCLIHGIRTIFQQIIATSKDEVSRWRELIILNINVDLSIIFNRVPELKEILGAKYSNIYEWRRNKTGRNSNSNSYTNDTDVNGDSTASKDQFNFNQIIGSLDQAFNVEMNFRYIIKMIYSLIGLEGLTIFLGDTQWCSSQEWAMISEALEFFVQNKIQNSVSIKIVASFGKLLVMDDSRATMSEEEFFEFLSKANLSYKVVKFGELDEASYKSYIYDTLYVSNNSSKLKETSSIMNTEVNDLGDALYKMNKGSIFFTCGFIKMAYFRGLVTYEADKRWNILYDKNLFTLDESQRVQSLFETLDKDILSVLKYASISARGFHFYLLDMILVTGLPMKKVVRPLYYALLCKVIQPGNTLYKFPFHLINFDDKNDSDTTNDAFFGLSSAKVNELASQTRYKFVHFSLNEVFHAHMKKNNEFELYHKNCGLRIYKNNMRLLEKMSMLQYLSMANHFVQSWRMVTLPEEKAIYLQVLIQAGEYASQTQRTSLSLTMFETAEKFIELGDIKNKLKIALTICQLHFHLQNYETCLKIISKTEDLYKGKSLEGLSIFILPRVRCLIMMERYQEGIEVALPSLKKVSQVEVSFDPGENEKIYDRASNQIPLSVYEITKLTSKPKTENPKILLTYELISEIMMPTYILNQHDLRKSLCAQTILLMHEYGVSSHCSIPILEYVNTFVIDANDSSFIKALELSKLALRLVDSDPTASFGRVQKVYENYISKVAVLIQPVKDVLKHFEVYVTNYERPLRMKNMKSYDTLKVGSKLQLLYFAGHPVEEIIKYGSKHVYSGELRSINYSSVQLEGFKLIHEDITYEQFMAQFDINCPSTSLEFKFGYYVMQLSWLAVNSKYDQAGEIIYDKIRHILHRTPFTLLHLHYYFYSSLVLRENPSSIPKKFRDLHWDKTYNFFSVWATNCPENFRTKLLLVEAMIKQYQKEEGADVEVLDILDLYEEAIEYAKIHDNWHGVAWGSFLCAGWLIKYGKNERRATPLMCTAYDLFTKNGDCIIVTRMMKKYGKYLENYNWAGINSNKFTHARNPSFINRNSGKPKLNMSFSSSNTSRPISQILSSKSQGRLQHTLASFDHDTSNSARNSGILNKVLLDMSFQNSQQSSSASNNTPHIAGDSTVFLRQTSNLSMNSVTLLPNSQFLPLSKVSTPVQMHFAVEKDSTSELNKAIKASLTISDSMNDSDILHKLLESTIQYSGADYGVVVLNINDEPYIQAIGTLGSIFAIDNEPLSSRTDLCPGSVIKDVLQTCETVIKNDDNFFETRYGKDDYYYNNSVFSVACVPLKNRSNVFGALYLEIQGPKKTRESDETSLPLPFHDTDKCDLLSLLCTQAAVTLEKSNLYNHMQVAKMAAEEATAEKASFLANISHEIRTPFNALLSCSIFLLDTSLTLTQREYVETIRLSAMVTLNIIDGVLAFSKMEHGSFLLECAPFLLAECIESALQLVGEQAASNCLELVYFNRCPEIGSIFGDITRFRQVVINLVGNAVKFTTNGYVKIETSAVQVTVDRYEISVIVTDTGIGIPKEAHNKVFGAFSQVDGSSQRIYGGAGLGLAISKKLADIMGGNLTFESTEGVGLKFNFTVNTQVTKQEEPEITVCLADCKGVFTPTALIIDLNKLGRSSLQQTLEEFGLSVKVVDKPIQIESESEYLIILVHSNLLKEFARLNGKSIKSKLVIISQHWQSNHEELQIYEFVTSIILMPFKKSKIVSILEEVKEKLWNGIFMLNEPFNRNEHGPNGTDNAIALQPNIVQLKLADKYPLRILVAEDNVVNVKVALQHLKKFGYKADHAKDGVCVLDMCNKKYDEEGSKYDVILMDIQMPRKDGFTASIELQEQFKREGKEDFLPVIVALTANVAGEERERSIECGMVDFISKPILPSELERVLTNLGEVISKKNH